MILALLLGLVFGLALSLVHDLVAGCGQSGPALARWLAEGEDSICVAVRGEVWIVSRHFRASLRDKKELGVVVDLKSVEVYTWISLGLWGFDFQKVAYKKFESCKGEESKMYGQDAHHEEKDKHIFRSAGSQQDIIPK